MYEYRCPEGHVSELLKPRTVDVVACPCGSPARREQVYHIGVTGFAETPVLERDKRQTYREYIEAVNEVGDAYDRARANGDPVQEPDYAAMARQQAISRDNAYGR